MPRKPRMYLPGVPAHIIQRGNNREPCFFAEDDYLFYLDRLGQSLRRYKVKLHAYVLMTNHVHLLMTPMTSEGISRVMSLLGQQYVMYINHTYRRSGTLREGRHKSSIVNAKEYILLCYRYIELNPVRAGMVEVPEAYPWSSYQHHGNIKSNPLIDDHEVFLCLGQTDESRANYYRELFKSEIGETELQEIRQTSYYNYPLGNDRFKKKIEKTLQRKIGYAKSGRPLSKRGG